MHIVDCHVIDVVRHYARFLLHLIIYLTDIFLTLILFLPLAAVTSVYYTHNRVNSCFLGLWEQMSFPPCGNQ